MAEVESQFPELLQGGRSRPRNCSARHRVAIIVPYRDRELHLRTFLLNIHSFLSRQVSAVQQARGSAAVRRVCSVGRVLLTTLSRKFRTSGYQLGSQQNM